MKKLSQIVKWHTIVIVLLSLNANKLNSQIFHLNSNRNGINSNLVQSFNSIDSRLDLVDQIQLQKINQKNTLNPKKQWSWFHHWFWFELETGYTYRHNAFYVKYLTDYNILELTGRIGLRIKKLPFEPYVFANPLHDVSTNPWNEVDWHNNFIYGVGVRHRFPIGNFIHLIFRECWLDIFGEKIWIHYFPSELFFTGHRPEVDAKLGVKFQLTYAGEPLGKSENNRIFHPLWLEWGGSLYYAKSSFYIRTKKGFYLLRLSGKAGPACFFASNYHFYPYASFQVIYDIGKADWNKLDWHNNIKFGFGARLQFLRFKSYQVGNSNFVFSIYGESQWIRYTKKVSYVPSYRPEHDWQMGIQVAISN